MQWILQDFEDTRKLAEALDSFGLRYSFHKVVPFVGKLHPEPEIPDSSNVVLFGSYTLWRFARDHGLRPGVFRIRPFVRETAWQPYLLNGADAEFMELSDVPDRLEEDGPDWFLRPVEDSKEIAGGVKSSGEILALANKVLALTEDELPGGSLRPDTQLMLTRPARIQKEWRCWVVDRRVVTYSLYAEGRRVTYRHEIDADAYEFVQSLVAKNLAYAPAYVIDVCRTAHGLKMLETNCLNAAGFYAADLMALVAALEELAQ